MTLLLAPSAPHWEPPTWARVAQVGASLWRVCDESGRPLGHLRAVRDDDAWVYRAERWSHPSRSFQVVGAFWSPAEALDCLRLSR
jgi:hypothetical protein